jgi:hypothetical protein
MSAWTRLTEDPEWCRGREAFPLPAYSEFLPPPWVSLKPYDVSGEMPHVPDDAFGWVVSEYEEEVELWPGLEYLARELLAEVMRLGKGELTRHITRIKLRNNPYWPTNLAARAGRLGHERYVLLAGVALSRTQDDKGRVRWTLFGSSEQGPGKAFWRGFFRSPTEEMPREEGFAFFSELLSRCYDVPESEAADPFAAGLRVLPTGRDAPCRYWDEGDLPSWASELLWKPRASLQNVRYLLTFRPFSLLPEAVQEAYLAGTLHLLPFPGSLVFWGIPGYRKLQKQLPLAQQMPLLSLFVRRADPDCLRVLQSGWLHEKGPNAHPEDRMRPTRPEFVRTHRWQKVHRHQDEVALLPEADKVTRVLFSTEPDDLELYNKPMARNVQIWTRDHRLVLDGPHHKAGRIARAEKLLAKGGTFGYRFVYPAMRVGPREVYWHRPVCAFAGAAGTNLGTNSVLLMNAPTGYLTAYDAAKPNPAKPVELWPRFLDRPEFDAAIELFRHECHPHRWHTTGKLRSLLRWGDLLGGKLPGDVARSLLALPPRQTVEAWLAALPSKAHDPVAGEALANRVRALIGPETAPAEDSLTFDRTATREFEESYWRTIAFLAHGKFRNKCSADCVRDDPTQTELESRHRELDALARHLVGEHAKTLEVAGVEGAWVGEHQFSWRTDFAYQWMGGWERNQHKRFQECNVIVRIPGRDSSQAVILADHYDTAYMHDRYYVAEGGTGARLAAAGADDNHSATAALLLAAPILLDLSRRGLLGCDVWLVHLTGEEFPADCLGARNLSRALVQGTLRVKDAASGYRDLSDVRIRGLYVADMIAHNNDKSKYVCQFAPGEGAAPARLAVIAHAVNLAWNELAAKLNKAAPRKGAKPPTRSDDPASIPPLAPHALIRGEIRPEWDPRSTLFNTDGQVFSDVGIPAVLFMEDYDINRKGYHDMHDTMANIDLDYGSALAAIFIETGARAAKA